MINNEEIIQGLIGHPLGHSYSPYIHKRLSGFDYKLFDLSKNELESFIKNTSYTGLNVTIPYKEEVIKYLDYVDDVAMTIGAVNTIIRRGDKTYGYNTDVVGFDELLKHYKINLRGKNVLILGTGGTKKTVQYVVSKYTKKIFIATRKASDYDNNIYNYDDLKLIENDINYIINTTPVGMSPNISSSPISLEKYLSLEGVIDVIYNPLHTTLLLEAKNFKIPYYNGLFMLVYQAYQASCLFFNKKYNEEILYDIYKELLLKNSSIMLIGMPASGKSTIGRILSEIVNQPFVDLDDEITKTFKKTPKEIIEEEGEAAFRNKETLCLSKYSNQNGLIIASGGGIVTNYKNYELIKHNFICVYLKRKPKEKSLNSSRPLSSSIDKWLELYQKRKELYEKFADIIVESLDKPIDTAYEVIKRIKKS